jgi:signal transduction histidine kinase/ligand-binding sensor domain-containing protein
MGVKPAVSLCQRISRLLSAIDAGFPSRMPRKLGAFLRVCARTFLLVALLTGARPSAALPTNLSLSQIQHTAWTAQEGAPADIWALAQSPDGFLMLGTGSGLYRFDGVTFERVIPSNQSELGFRNITALIVLPSGEIWIGYYAGGVSELKNGVLTSYGPHEGVPSGWITSFVREIDGTLWVAAREGLGRFSAGHWETVSSDWNFHGHGAHWVLLDRQGTLWATGGETVEFLPRGAHKFEDTGIRCGYNSTLALAPNGTVWLGGESVSPRPLTMHQPLLIRDQSAAKLDPVKRILVDRDGSIWATDSLRGGVYRETQPNPDADTPTSHSSNEMFTEAEGLTSNLAVPLMEDQEGNIWVGTNLGLNRFRSTRFVREWRVPASRTLYALAAAPDGSVWIGSHEQLFEAQGSRCDLVAHLPSPIRSAYVDPSGALWLGTEDGLVELLDKKPSPLPLPAPAQPVQYQYVHAMTSDTSHGLWVSVVNRGLLRLNDTRWNLPGSGLHLPEATPTALWTDTAGRQWLGYDDGTAALSAGDSSQIFGPHQGLDVGPIMVIRGSASEIFVGGEWGLARFDGRRFQSLSASRSEAFSGISGIIVRANGDIWLNGNRGVVHMSSDALSDAYNHPLEKLSYDLFDVRDGLPGYAQQGEDASAVAAADGRLWFATNHGIAWIDPDHLIKNGIPPNVVIRSVVADQRTYQSAGQIELPESTRSVRFDYTALSLGEPERVRFRYKLEGADDTLRGAGNERSVRYADLRPGHYTFRVIASNNDGVWNEQGASVDITITPAWWQTWQFRAACVAAFLFMLWALYQMRLRQIARVFNVRLEERVAERTRIARDLHDTLLQSFQALLLHFQTAYVLFDTRPADAKEALGSSIDQTAQAITEGREAVQGLRASTVESNDLAQAITTLGEQLAAETSGATLVGLHVEVAGTPRNLHPIVRDEIYRIAGEALRNAFRHAEAQQIEVEFRYDERQLRLRIRDDGKGIDAMFLAAEGRTGHFGLHGMRERAKLMGGKLTVWTAAESGTEIELTIPAARAYAASPRRSWFAEKFLGTSKESKS